MKIIDFALAAAVLGIAAPAAAQSLDCANGRAIYDAWTPGREAYSAGDKAKAKTIIDAMIAACPTAPLLDMPRVMRADIALSEEDYAGALAVLADVERPMTPGLGPLPNFIALKAAAGLRDAEVFARERTTLVSGIESRLTDPQGSVKARLVERFNVGDLRVNAFEGDYQNGPFVRHVTFIIDSPAPFVAPRSIMLTTSPATAMLGGPRAFFLDHYDCDSHATLEIVQRRKPTYKALRDKVERHLANAGSEAVSGTTGGAGVCPMGRYVAPGFEE